MGHPSGGYDAIRVYLWAGMLDQRANARSAVLNSLSGMRAYMVAHDAPPERIAVDGTVIENHAPVGFSAAVIPFLLAAGENAAARAQSDRLKRERVAANWPLRKRPALLRPEPRAFLPRMDRRAISL